MLVKIVAYPFNIISPTSSKSEFEDENEWDILEDGLDAAVLDEIIFLDKHSIPSDNCDSLVSGIKEYTACIVSNGPY